MTDNSSLTGLPSASLGPTELASAHAQLLLIGEAIRTAVSGLAVSPPRGPPSPQSQKQQQVRMPQKGQVSPPVISLPSTPTSGGGLPLATPLTADVAAATGPRSVMITATDRLAALHDLLRRVQTLMKEYETVSQRVVEMHLQPSPSEEAADGAVAVKQTATREGIQQQQQQKQKLTPEPPTPTRRSNSQTGPARPGPQKQINYINMKKSIVTNTNGNTNTASSSDGTTGPSLHQRRALASNASFTRFCGLRVEPEHLLLPWSSQTTSGPAFNQPGFGGGGGAAAAFRTTLDKGELALNSPARPPSSCSSASESSAGSGHSMASAALRTAQQQRQQAAATAHLSAYSRFFFHPQSPFKLTPVFSENTSASEVEAYLSSPAAAVDPVNGPGVLLRELRDTQSQFESLRRCRLFSYEGRLRELKAAAAADEKEAALPPAGVKRITAASPVDEPKWEHTSVLVERMCDVLSALRLRFVAESHYAYCGTPAATLGRQLHAWTQPLLRQLNEILSNPTIEDVDQDLREKLRRMRFDAEELQQEQADAIANGDMHRSEELYYEQTALLEAMNGPYDEMEQLLTEYLEECVMAPLAALQEHKATLTARLTKTIEEHTSKLTEVTQDIDRVKEKRRSVIQSRQRQRNAMSSYQHSWKKEWQGNSEAQMACYRAMEQLENRLSSLQKAQSILAEDWLTHMELERQREEDAAAFACFAEARTQALMEAQRNLQSVVDGLRQLSGAIHFSCNHAEAFARDVLQSHVNNTQLALRKDRLAQFRALYLTLGDWRFKKSRNAEEMQKKIEYYTLQQEVAMDVSNPKAREYSQAKQQWEAAKTEALAQLDQLDDRSRLQLEAFRPTEKLLKDAGVDFVSPEEELTQRNLQRTQRLVEYQQLIEEGIGVRSSGSRSTAPNNDSSNTKGGGAESGLPNAATKSRLPALMPGPTVATIPTPPFMANHSSLFASPSGSLRSKEDASELTRATQHAGAPPAAEFATTAASSSETLYPSAESGKSGSGAASTLPPISSKASVPPRLHST